MSLKKLVPPPELCKLIPAGEFAESVFLREAEVNIYTGEIINDRIVPRPKRIKNNPYVNHDLGREYHLYPAPTLQEIMSELPACDCYRFTDKNEWTVLLVNGPVDDGVKSDSPATAALKLWLKVKGIEA